MSKILFIAEKPSAAKSLAEALGKKSNGKGFYNCEGDAVVTWLYGHVLELIDAKDYDPKYAKWVLDDLPFIPNEFVIRPPIDVVKNGKKLVDNAYRRDQLDTIIKLIEQTDEVCIASDPDNEGELLGVEILDYLGYKGKTTRMYPTSMLKASLLKAVDAKFDASKSRKNYYSALSRSHLDWLVGINVTRALTAYNQDKIESPLYIGRVQTFILGELYRNELARKNFIAKPTYSLSAKSSINEVEINFSHKKKPETKEILDHSDDTYDATKAEAHIKSIIDKLKGKDGEITNSEKKRVAKAPPLGYMLGELQVACANKYGMSSADVLRYCQAMYEAKHLTYPRTDNQYMPEGCHSDGEAIAKGWLSVEPDFANIDDMDFSRKTKVWNDKKFDNHHAIIPTPLILETAKFDKNHILVYELIMKRFLMQFMPDYEADNVNLTLTIDDEEFKATGSTPVIKGWKSLEDKAAAGEDSEGEEGVGVTLPQVDQGTVVSPIELINKVGKTSKPSPFTEARLLKTLANAHKLVSDKVLADNMKKRKKGIGTQATTANIIESMMQRGLFKASKKNFELQPKGRTIAEVAPEALLSADMTAELEFKFLEIEKEETTYEEVLADYTKILHEITQDVKDGKHAIAKSLVKKWACKSCESGEVVQRRVRKTGKKIWICQSCDSFYEDRAGRPDKKIERIAKQECPSCKEQSVGRYESKSVKGAFTWFCTNKACGKRYQDDNGKLNPTIHSCKKCSSDLVMLFAKKSKKPFFMCTSESCKQTYPEKENLPDYEYEPPKVSEHKCLDCGGGLIRREGQYGAWWGCSNWNRKPKPCKQNYKDNDGEPILVLEEKFSCPECKGTLQKRNGKNGAFFGCSNWNRKTKPCKKTFPEKDGKPDFGS